MQIQQAMADLPTKYRTFLGVTLMDKIKARGETTEDLWKDLEETVHEFLKEELRSMMGS